MVRDLGSTLGSQLPRPAGCDQSPAGRAGELQRVSGASRLLRGLPQATWRQRGPAPTSLTYSFTLSSSNIHRGAVRGSTWIKPKDNDTEPKGLLLPPRALALAGDGQ